MKSTIRKAVALEELRARNAGMSAPSPPLPSTEKLSARSFRCGAACSLQRQGHADTIICDLLDWKQVKTMQTYLRRYNSLNTANGLNVSDVALMAATKTAAARDLVEQVGGAPLGRVLTPDETRAVFAMLDHREEIIKQLVVIEENLRAQAAAAPASMVGAHFSLVLERVEARLAALMEEERAAVESAVEASGDAAAAAAALVVPRRFVTLRGVPLESAAAPPVAAALGASRLGGDAAGAAAPKRKRSVAPTVTQELMNAAAKAGGCADGWRKMRDYFVENVDADYGLVLPKVWRNAYTKRNKVLAPGASTPPSKRVPAKVIDAAYATGEVSSWPQLRSVVLREHPGLYDGTKDISWRNRFYKSGGPLRVAARSGGGDASSDSDAELSSDEDCMTGSASE